MLHCGLFGVWNRWTREQLPKTFASELEAMARCNPLGTISLGYRSRLGLLGTLAIMVLMGVIVGHRAGGRRDRTSRI
jgi:hypothetical protein